MSIFKKTEQYIKEYCLIGLSKFNQEVGRKLLREGHRVTILDKDERKIDMEGEEFTHAMICDCTSQKELNNVGVKFFDYVILGINDMKTSVITAVNLKELGVKNIICKAKDEMHKKVLQFLGIKTCYIPEEEVSTAVAYKVMHDLNVDLFSWNHENSDTLVVKIPVSNKDRWNKKVSACKPTKTPLTIISIKRSNEEIITPVGGEEVIKEGDTVCLICHKEQIEELKKYFGSNS